MYLNTHIFPTSGYARVLLFMFVRQELGGTGTECLFQFTCCDCGRAIKIQAIPARNRTRVVKAVKAALSRQ